MLPPALQAQLHASPAEAVESPVLLELYRCDPEFYQQLDAPDRWRLLFGLAISLLDYADRLDLEAHLMALPGDLPSLSLWQICDGLICIDFQLDGLDWSEELQLTAPLSLAQVEACDAVLSSLETQEKLNTLIAEALRFIEGCDDFPAPALGQIPRRQGWLQRTWRTLRGKQQRERKSA
jgi:hypothetical protein